MALINQNERRFGCICPIPAYGHPHVYKSSGWNDRKLLAPPLFERIEAGKKRHHYKQGGEDCFYNKYNYCTVGMESNFVVQV